MFVMLAGFEDAAAAEANRQEWLDMAREQYRIEDTFDASYNGQDFTIIIYTFASDTNPYAQARPLLELTGTLLSVRNCPAGNSLMETH